MIKHVLSEIGGIGLYGVVSISLFFCVFIGVLIRSMLLKRSFLDRMSRLPLMDGEVGSFVDAEVKHE